jgi:hypothetical protein
MFCPATRRGNVLERLRQRLTYGNVMSTVAVFIAFGGTSYAFTLSRNSVGSRELKPRSVGASELKTGAVSSTDIKNRGIRLTDVSLATRAALRGQRGEQGPPGADGVSLFAKVDAGGGYSPSSVGTRGAGVGGRVVFFQGRSVASCGYSASLARVDGGSPGDPPPGATITVAPSGDGGVLVRTWDAANQPTWLPFHLIVAC